jgi:hypothetical protein
MHALGRFGDGRWKLSLDALGIVAYTNGWRLLLRDSVWTLPGGKDVRSLVRGKPRVS